MTVSSVPSVSFLFLPYGPSSPYTSHIPPLPLHPEGSEGTEGDTNGRRKPRQRKRKSLVTAGKNWTMLTVSQGRATTGWTLVSLGSYLPVHSLRASLVVLSPTDNGTERV